MSGYVSLVEQATAAIAARDAVIAALNRALEERDAVIASVRQCADGTCRNCLACWQRMLDRLGVLAEARNERVANLEAALAGVLEWLDSEPVRQTFRQMATISTTHPHLKVTLPVGFADWARTRIDAARAALPALTGTEKAG